MVRQDRKRSCWISPKGHHNRWSLEAVVANQAVAFDKSMLTACPHLGDVLRPGLILDHGQTGQKQKGWTSDPEASHPAGWRREQGTTGLCCSATTRHADRRPRPEPHLLRDAVSVERNVPPMEADGLLPTVLFHLVFISSGHHYVVFDPK
jgi:hypothetical protein